MLARFEGARVIDTGDWEIDGTKYPWIDLLQRHGDLPAGLPERDSTGVERFGLSLPARIVDDKPVPAELPKLEFGDLVSGVLETSTQAKVVRGTDRALNQTKARIVALEVVAAAAGKPVRAAA